VTGAVFFEICATHLQVRLGGDTLDMPLQRDESGQITAACRAQIITAAGGFLSEHQVRPGSRAVCAIGGHGVSLRRLSLPVAPKEEFQRLLRLQLEREFPMPPDQLAWGSRVLRQDASRQEVLVAAIRKDSLQPWIEIFSACGINPDFTVAALLRAAPFGPLAGSCAVLHLGRRHSELLIYEDGFPAGIRVLNWGRDNIAGATADGINVSKIYLTDAEAATLLPNLGGIPCAYPQATSAAETPPLILRGKEPPGRVTLGDVRSRKPLVLAAVLACAVLMFPLAQAVVLKPFLSRHLAAMKTGQARLGAIDREIDFLQYLKANQPPYLDTLFLLATCAPPGTSFESISLGRRGELSLRGKLGNAQQVTDFRSKLIEAGWFSSVVVEEQTPSPDRRVTVRMTAQLKAADSRKPLPEEPAHK
jgi:hypothetical protein